MSESLLEPDYAEAYSQWKADPTPQANADILRTLDPVIRGAVRTHTGGDSQLLYGRARRMALAGLRSYDPGRGRLQSHLYAQLQGLKRYAGRLGRGVQVPERIALDRTAMEKAEQALALEHGRDPTDEELADRTGLSYRRMARIRGYAPAMSSGYFESLAEANSGFAPTVQQQEASRAWIHLVYDDLSPSDRLILEHSVGLNGRPILSNQALAAKLRRTPGAISQRKRLIQALLDQEQALSPFAR